MLTEVFAPRDGITLARQVRRLGLSASRNLSRPRDTEEAQELLRMIETVESDLIGRPTGDLSRWLQSLRKRIEDHQGLVVS